ncbi:hypothetical protein KCU77_g488, partial [Aureobasidium melanogenum]
MISIPQDRQPVQPTTTETSATETSLPTTTTSTSSDCTPIPTCCDGNGFFSLMASNSDSSINGKYAQIRDETFVMYGDSNNAYGFCLDNNNILYSDYSGSPPATKGISNGPVQIDSNGTPLTCTALMNEDCTNTLSCTWYNNSRMVVDDWNDNTLYVVGDNDEDFGGSGDPIPVTLIMQGC